MVVGSVFGIACGAAAGHFGLAARKYADSSAAYALLGDMNPLLIDTGLFLFATENIPAQAKSLGFAHSPIYVEHPIQDRTDEEMVAIGEQAFDALVAQLVEQE